MPAYSLNRSAVPTSSRVFSNSLFCGFIATQSDACSASAEFPPRSAARWPQRLTPASAPYLFTRCEGHSGVIRMMLTLIGPLAIKRYQGAALSLARARTVHIRF